MSANNNNSTVFNTLCVYGASGTGKTREIGAMSLYIWEKYKKRTRLISADGGGWGSIQDYVDAGLVEAVNISDAETPLTLLRRLARGDWYMGGKWLDRKAQVESWPEVGMYAIEGFSSICNLILRDLVEKGRKISEEVVGKFSEKDAETGEAFQFGAPGRSHYGFVQNALTDIIRDFQGLTNHGVRQILFTSLESSGEESLTKKKVLGPASAGNALTQILPQRVGDLIHLDIVPVEEKGKAARQEYRAYFQSHVDPDINRSWPCKLRVSPEASLKLAADSQLAKGFIPLTDEEGVTRQGLSRLFRWRDEVSREGAERLKGILNGGEAVNDK
jgi:hypothetical protein